MSFILRRLVFYLVTAWVALTINFFIPRAMPGNAVESIMSKFPNLQPSAYQALEAMLGVGHPGSIWHRRADPGAGPDRAVRRGEPADHPDHDRVGVVRVQLAELHWLADPGQPLRDWSAVRSE
jgi:hypothetical protein